jgi:hypothetical protein
MTELTPEEREQVKQKLTELGLSEFLIIAQTTDGERFIALGEFNEGSEFPRRLVQFAKVNADFRQLLEGILLMAALPLEQPRQTMN